MSTRLSTLCAYEVPTLEVGRALVDICLMARILGGPADAWVIGADEEGKEGYRFIALVNEELRFLIMLDAELRGLTPAHPSRRILHALLLDAERTTEHDVVRVWPEGRAIEGWEEVGE